MKNSNIDEEVFHNSNTNIDIKEARTLQSWMNKEGFKIFVEKFLPYYQQYMTKKLYQAGDHATSERIRGRFDAAQEIPARLEKTVKSKLNTKNEEKGDT